MDAKAAELRRLMVEDQNARARLTEFVAKLVNDAPVKRGDVLLVDDAKMWVDGVGVYLSNSFSTGVIRYELVLHREKKGGGYTKINPVRRVYDPAKMRKIDENGSKADSASETGSKVGGGDNR